MLTKSPGSVHSSTLGVDGLLDLWVHSYHAVVEVRVLAHEDIGVPRHGNKNRVDTAAQRRREDFAC